jgi:hypothetical protein
LRVLSLTKLSYIRDHLSHNVSGFLKIKLGILEQKNYKCLECSVQILFDESQGYFRFREFNSSDIFCDVNLRRELKTEKSKILLKFPMANY